jgi:hypothetical protein
MLQHRPKNAFIAIRLGAAIGRNHPLEDFVR